MSQTTLVVTVPTHRHSDLRERFSHGNFEWGMPPHSVFRIKGEGCVATLYKSGKFVIQGPDPELFLTRHTDLTPPAKSVAAASDPIMQVTGPMVGSDETGKGDYFGPLVVAAVRIDPELAQELTELGVADSKKLSDPRALSLGAALRERVSFSVQRLLPADYNPVYDKIQNLNPLLADLHGRAIREIVQTGDRVLVDQFANASLMKKTLSGVDIQLQQATKAERNVAVAAASIIARQEFLASLQELSSEFCMELPKGAGSNVDQAARDFVRTFGRESLGRVAKLHFKTTQKL